MNIAIIPARGGSKRLKNKNIMDFFGRPMISYPLSAARESGLFDRIHVSTDSEEVRDVVEKLGFPVDFLRPANLADDATGIMPVMQWVLETYRSRGIAYDTASLLLPCAPLIDAVDLRDAYEVFRQHGCRKPLMAVSTFPVAVEWAYRRTADGSLVPVTPGAYAIRSQDLEKAYYDSGSFYFYASGHILTDRPATDRDYVSYELPRTKAVDIDDEEDLELARALFRARGDRRHAGASHLRAIADERALRLRSRNDEGFEAEATFRQALSTFRGTALEEQAHRAHDYAASIDYTHAGLSPRAYLAHPVRVAALAMTLDPGVQPETVVCGLLHNVFEVSRVTPADVAARFGEPMAEGIGRLTVDRAQDTHAYKASYYGRIGDGPRWLRVVKVLDKLDNLFLLCLNQDAEVRRAYLGEIEEFIMPIVRAELPALEGYMDALIADCRETGCVDTPAVPVERK